MKQRFNHEFYQKLIEVDLILAETYLKEHPEKSKSKKKIPWPLKNKWWYHKRFNDVKKRFKFLEAILIEIGDSKYRLSQNECKKLSFTEKHLFILNRKGKTLALMRLNCKEMIAENIGCSVDTVKNYMAALTRIGALRVDNFGKGRKYYSCGYWGQYKNKEGIINFKVIKFMNQNIAKKLTDPMEFYKRKPNKI